MLNDDKKTLLQGSDFFAEQGLKIKNQSKNPSAIPTNDPFYKMASSGNPKDQLYIAKNPNSTPEALRLLKDSKDEMVQKALAANPNSPQEVLNNLPKDIQEKQKNKEKDIQERQKNREKDIQEAIKNEWNKEFENLEWDGSGSVDAYDDNSNLGVNNIASWLKESPRRKEEMDRILNDPNTPESRKEILRERIKAANKQNATDSRLKREEKQKEQKVKRQEEIENQKAQRAQEKQERQEEKQQKAEKIDRLKRARSGDFSGIEIPKNTDVMTDTDKQYWEEISRRKKTKEQKQQKTEKINTLKRARSGDFSGIEIPEDTSSMSDTDKKYWQEISRRKKTKEEKDERERKRKEKQNPKDNNETKPQQQKSFFQSDDEIEVQQDPEDRINSFMYGSGGPQTQEMDGSGVINSIRSSLSSSKNDLKNITSDNAQHSKKSAENMDRLQNQIKDLDLKIRTQQSTKMSSTSQQNTAAMTYSTNVTKSQQNTNKPVINSDPITDLNQEYKETPRFKNDLG